ncbi:MAG: WecB/TagA/CpsF family glycosyltransferase [Lachnospiraceae bacterium]
MLKRRKLFGIPMVIAGPEEAVDDVLKEKENLSGQYISFANAHTTVMAHENREFHEVQKGAFYVMPDGRPLSKLLRMRGYQQAGQIAGPDFMERMMEATKHGEVSHYFYGGSEETIRALEKKLRERYPELSIAGMESPPFRPLTEAEEQEMTDRINDSGADFIWIGLGAPKQECFMAAHRGIFGGVMFGVGAAFDFHAETVKRAPVWMQKCYLEWLYRLMQEPGRLWKRYVVTNTKFLLMILTYRLRNRNEF